MDPNNYNPTPNTPTPNTATPLSSVEKLKKTKQNLIILSILLVILLVVSGLLGYRAYEGTAKLNDKYDEGYEAGQAQQKQVDEAKIADIEQNPYRTYTSPKELGEFSVSFPRNWSISINSSSSDPLLGYVNPDFVDIPSNTFALRVALKEAEYDELLNKYRQQAKSSKGKLTETTAKISGIEGVRFNGQIDQKIANGSVIIVPLRDKTFLIQTDDRSKFGTSYDDIITKVKLNP